MSTATKAKKPAQPTRKAGRKPARRAAPVKIEPIEYLPPGAVKLAKWEVDLMNRSPVYGPEA